MDGKNTGIKCPKCQLATSTSKTVTQLRTSQASLPLQTFIPSEQGTSNIFTYNVLDTFRRKRMFEYSLLLKWGYNILKICV